MVFIYGPIAQGLVPMRIRHRVPHGPVPCARRLGDWLPNDSRSRDL